jgi:2-polyprenyl-3-methyl-5-hydroxy-6-metoxy-1,4-benzoquinol methylase
MRYVRSGTTSQFDVVGEIADALRREFGVDQRYMERMMRQTELPTLQLQKEHWKFWNFRPRHPYEDDLLRPIRRGDKILDYLRSLPLERPTLLDMGCGMGWFANRIAEFGPTTGIDLSDEAIALAKSKFPQVTFIAGDVFEMELPEEHFDVVVSQEVIAHVPDQSGYLERAARVLKPGGYLIVTTPNPFVHFRNHWAPIPPGHIEQWLSRGALRRLLHPRFRVLRTTTAVPLGHRGILRLVNSIKLNQVAELLFSTERVEAVKEWAGLGWTQIVLAQKRS